MARCFQRFEYDVFGNAFFVGSEIALTSARRSRIKQLASTGNKSAKIVQVLHNEPERFYSVTQIGITLVSLALGAIGMVTLTQIMDPGIEAMFALAGDSDKIIGWAHTFSYVVAFIIISFLHVVAGELAPKVLAFFYTTHTDAGFPVSAFRRIGPDYSPR